MALSVVSRSQKQAVHSLQPYLLLQAICTARSFFCRFYFVWLVAI